MLSHSWLKLGVWFAENPETFLQYYWLVSYSLVVFMHLNFLFWALYLVFIEFKHSDFNPCFHLLTLLKSWLLLSWVFATYCSFNMTSILSCQLSKALKNILNAAYNESLHYVDWHLTIGQIIFGNFLVSALLFFFFPGYLNIHLMMFIYTNSVFVILLVRMAFQTALVLSVLYIKYLIKSYPLWVLKQK